MITINILNPEQVAEYHAGKFKIMIAKTFGINLKKRIEENMAKQLQQELLENGLEADVRVQ